MLFKVFHCSEQFLMILFCTDCLTIIFEGYKYNNQLLRARMTKHLCNDFAVIFQCPTTVNKQEVCEYENPFLKSFFPLKKWEQTTISTCGENENLLQFCLPYQFAHAGKYNTPTLILKEQFYMWINLFSLENISGVLRCFHSDTGLAQLRWIKVAVKPSGTLPLKK